MKQPLEFDLKRRYVPLLLCPGDHRELQLSSEGQNLEDPNNESLVCYECQRRYKITGGVPRFVPASNYASNFGFEWNQHWRTQYDSHTCLPLSKTRLLDETGWPADMTGETILEVGSGSGRFTEVAASTGATVVSVDYSNAVDANYRSNGHKPNVLILQADMYRLPVKTEAFDRVFCFGVLQHTPDVKSAFMALVPPLKPGGYLAVDVYRGGFWRVLANSRYWVRPFTCRLPSKTLYAITKRYVEVMWPMARVIRKLPRGRRINRTLLVADYGGLYPLSNEHLKQWAILDTFDGLSPRYDEPQTASTLKKWFEEAGLVDIKVGYGMQGVIGQGRKRP